MPTHTQRKVQEFTELAESLTDKQIAARILSTEKAVARFTTSEEAARFRRRNTGSRIASPAETKAQGRRLEAQLLLGVLRDVRSNRTEA